MLIIMENRNVENLFKPLLNLKTLRSFYILKVYSSKSRGNLPAKLYYLTL